MTGRDRAAARIVELLDAPLLRALTEPARVGGLERLLGEVRDLTAACCPPTDLTPAARLRRRR